ncbi:unnamed protein product [Ostreobium quekettii]|uniref:Hexosyltransferase n=1 Tax=Ostreobium quekettii TaxID=121088 RepID=A0A8S1J581_9CHLO|nr:unnamed protein product [Ostreobium quekettii]
MISSGATVGHNKQRGLTAPESVLVHQTGFTHDIADKSKYNYQRRRGRLRETWFPENQAALDRLQQKENIVLRFVIGKHDNPEMEQQIGDESNECGGCFLRIDFEERYLNLAHKTLAFISMVVSLYDADYIVKIDDDVYLRLDRLPSVVRQWSSMKKDYVGCMKNGQIFTDRHYRWYEPQHRLLGSKTYFTHAWGCVYALSGRAAALLSSIDPNMLRFFNNEDVTLGSWLLAFNISHYDDRRLCEASCSQTSLVVYDFPDCAGLCDPYARLPEVHADPQCKLPTFPEGSQEVPKVAEIIKCDE